MPSITRRRALAAAGSVGALGAGALGVESFAGPAPTFDDWTPATEDWPARRRDPQRTAAAPAASPPTAAPEVVWQVAGPGGDALVVAGGTAYVGDEDGVTAVDLEDGTELWTGDAAGNLLCHYDDTLFCAHSGTLVGLEDDTGERRFAADEPFHRIRDLLPLEDVLLVGDHGVLRGCDPATGSVEWERGVGGLGEVSAAVDAGRLYAGGPGPLETYGPHEGWDAIRHDGPRQLERGLGPTFGTEPVVGDEGVYIGGREVFAGTAAFGFDRDGRQVWEGPSGHHVSSPALDGDHGVLWTWDREREPEYRMHGIDLADGTTIWSDAFEAVPTTPVVAGELAIVGGRDGSLLAREPETGTPVWETDLEGGVEVVVPAGDRLVVAGRDGVLRCLR